MKKGWRRVLAATVIGAGILCGILQTPFAGKIMEVEAAENIASGVVDDAYGQITWVINSEGHLTVTGTGDVSTGRTERRTPWYEYRNEIVTAEIDVTGMTDASYLFYGCSGLQSINMVGFDTSDITDMKFMFHGCKKLETLDLSGFDTSDVTDMQYMFYGCETLETLDLSGFDSSKVTSMSWMFDRCKSLEKLNLNGFDTRNVEFMVSMFEQCSSLKNLDLSDFDTKNVTLVNSMFADCTALEKLDISGFNTGNVTSMERMFSNCRALKSLDLDEFDTANVTDMKYMFYTCKTLEELDLSSFSTINVYRMNNMFEACTSLNVLDVSGFDTSNVSTMIGMFRNCNLLEKLDLSSFVISNKCNTEVMLYNCWSLSQIETPRGCAKEVELPKTSGYAWYLPDGTATTVLPQNLGKSVVLTKKPVFVIESFVVDQKKEVEFNAEKGYFSGILKLQSGSESSQEFMNSIVKSIQWSSSDASIVNASTITCDGVSSYDGLSSELMIGFKPQKAGKVIITGTLNGRTVSCEVTVIDNRAQIKDLQMQKKLYRKRKDNIYIEAELYLTEEGEASEEILFDYVNHMAFTSSNSDVAEVEKKLYTFGDDYRSASIKVSLKNKSIGKTEIEGVAGELVAKTELQILDNSYAAELDGWPIVNTMASFGYDEDEDYFSFKHFKSIYGNYPISIIKFIDHHIGGWKGSCFGMALTSAANYEGKINFKNYFENKENRDYLAEYGYTGKFFVNPDRTELFDIRSNRSVIDIIERAHISQFSKEFIRTEIGEMDKDYSEVIQLVQSGNGCILAALEDDAGHAVVIDNYEGTTDGEWHVFSVYDCNYPAGGEYLDNPHEFYKYKKRLGVNIETGEWEYQIKTGDSWECQYFNNYCDKSNHKFIRFYDLSRLTDSFFEEPLHYCSNQAIYYSTANENFSISNEKQVLLAFDENGLTELAEGYDYNLYYSGEDSSLRYINLDENHLNVQMEKGDVLFYDSENGFTYSVSCDGESEIYFNSENSSVDVAAKEDTNIVLENVIVDSSGKNEITEIKFELEKGEELELINKEHKLILQSTKEKEVEILVTDEEGRKIAEYKEILKKEIPSNIKKDVINVFTDVYNDWYTSYVQYVYDNNLMTGIKGTTEFQPNNNITKAQVAQVLYNMEGQPVVNDRKAFTDLKDVYEVEWYANAVAWAYNTGVVTGDLNTKKFSPNANVTREQLALMLYRYAQFKKYSTIQRSDLSGLKNAENVSNWASDGVRWAVGVNLISGIEKNGIKDLAPQGNATRAQVAAILQRFCENVIK